MSSLDVLFRPRAVAVIGASRDRRSVGGAILHNLLTFEFQGQVFPVNPRASVVHSLKCYPTVEAIPDPVDSSDRTPQTKTTGEQREWLRTTGKIWTRRPSAGKSRRP